MYNLTNPAEIKKIMNRYGNSFKKSLGQNFLINEDILDKIIAGSQIGAQDNVLEIGPGIGVLTKKLAMTGAAVSAVEIDRQLIPVLEETLAGFNNVSVVLGDFMKLDLASLIQEQFGGGPIKVAANLPYYITTPIIMKLLEHHHRLSSITVMVQKEVAERFTALHNTPDYGAVSIAIQYRTKAELLCHVPAQDFLPAPKVDSAVVKLTILPEPSVYTEDETLFFRIVKGGFAQRRKTLQNSLSSMGFEKKQVAAALENLSLSPTIRGEALSLQDYAALTSELKKFSI